MTDHHTPFNDFDATMICEGVQDPPGQSPEDQRESYLAAWQYLIDSGLAWRLQGWFGRMAHQLIEQGYCNPPAARTRNEP